MFIFCGVSKISSADLLNSMDNKPKIPWFDEKHFKNLIVKLKDGDKVSPWLLNFVIRDKTGIDLIRKILSERSAKNDLKPLKSLNVGDFVTCYYYSLFRGYVFNHVENRYSVLDVDTGNKYSASIASMFSLPDELTLIPAQFLCCCLTDNPQKDYHWDENVNKRFIDIIQKYILAVTVICEVKENNLPKLFVNLDGVDIVKEVDVNISIWFLLRLLPCYHVKSSTSNKIDENKWDPTVEMKEVNSQLELLQIQNTDAKSTPNLEQNNSNNEEEEFYEDNDELDDFDHPDDNMYVGKDYERMCHLYLRHGKCFKIGCRKEHYKLREGQITKDKLKVFVEPFNDIILPEKSCSLDVKVSSILNPLVWIVKLPPVFSDIGEPIELTKIETYRCLLANMNDSANIRNCKRFDKFPCVGELCLAFSKKIKKWLRGKILTVNERNIIKIFFIDEGFEEDVMENKHLLKIDPKFLHLPIQAVECHLTNIRLMENCDMNKVMEYLNNIVLGKLIIIQVIKSDYASSKLDVIAWQGKDEMLSINAHLVEKGYCSVL